MGGNSVHDAEALKLICEFKGCKVDGEARELRAEILELVLRKDARGAVAGTNRDRLQISGGLDPQAVELLRLEIHRRAARPGADITGFQGEIAAETVASGRRRGMPETACLHALSGCSSSSASWCSARRSPSGAPPGSSFTTSTASLMASIRPRTAATSVRLASCGRSTSLSWSHRRTRAGSYRGSRSHGRSVPTGSPTRFACAAA